MTINLPYSDLGFAVGPHRRRAARGDAGGAREAIGRRSRTPEHRHRAGLRPRRRRSHAAPRRAARAPRRTKPGCGSRPIGTLTSLARPVAPLLLGLRERRGKEEPLRRNERLGQPSVKRPAGRLAWFHAASVGETNAILPLMSALAEERPALSFLLTTGTVTSAKLAAQRLGPRAIHQYAPLDAPEYVRELPRPLAAGSGGLHRVRRSGPT